ncbi:MAG TPA: squalene/phytoene synthase family protein, partial [Jatrophihabitans sp.]|nr:squalene/phytoene synthase family protein [Jatrophihabitans sp.]
MTGAITVDAAYRECERITGAQARNFAWGIRLLPTAKRRALSAVYALARRIDDIGDGPLPGEEKLRRLEQARKAVADPGAHPDDPVLVALDDAARRFPIPLAAFGELVDGCEMDVRGRRYDTLDDLVGYCRCVAGSIGRLSLGVFDPPLAPAQADTVAAQADELGVALQLTNILRDLREDLTNGRVYLPAGDLELFGAQLRLLPDGTLDPMDGALAEVIRFEAARAAGRYDRGLRLLDALDRRSAACCAAMAGIYRELLDRIAARPERVLTTRLSLPAGDKLRVAVQALV